MAHRQEGMHRREKAAEVRPRLRQVAVKYRIENGDIYILSGPYLGKSVKELWPIGPVERDYIVRNIWFSGDAEVAAIIRGLSCQ